MRHILIWLILLIATNYANSQTKNWRISVGVGFPEYLNIGIGKKINSKQLIEFSYGTYPKIDNIYSLTLEHYLFLSDSKTYDNLKTWYFGQKANFIREGVKFPRDLYILGADLGRQFNLSNRIGFLFDLGVAYIYERKKSLNSVNETIILKKNGVIPTGHIGVLYRF
jgi:hypothetical protein